MDDNTMIEQIATDNEHHNSTNLVHNNRANTLAFSDLINATNITYIVDNNRLDNVLSSNSRDSIMQQDYSPHCYALRNNFSLFSETKTSPTENK